MADNRDEAHLENPANSQPENSSNAITPSTYTETIISTQETENMEVHHHTHHGHDKRNWKSYFWEFLMLFLAVFCGFIAEYLLEHKIEKEKSEQYINSFYEDLKTDTTNFGSLILQYKAKIQILNTRGDCFDTVSHNIESPNCLRVLFDNSSRFPDLVYTDGTLQQLKNSGGLRLLSIPDADSILLYDNLLKQYTRAETTSFQETQAGIRSTLYSLINYQKTRPNTAAASILVADHKELLNRFFNQLDRYTYYCNANIKDITEIKLTATSLIYYFKNKYHFN